MILRLKEYRALFDNAIKEAKGDNCNCGDGGYCGCGDCGDCGDCGECNSYR